jgi:hypothetical protein
MVAIISHRVNRMNVSLFRGWRYDQSILYPLSDLENRAKSRLGPQHTIVDTYDPTLPFGFHMNNVDLKQASHYFGDARGLQ